MTQLAMMVAIVSMMVITSGFLAIAGLQRYCWAVRRQRRNRESQQPNSEEWLEDGQSKVNPWSINA